MSQMIKVRIQSIEDAAKGVPLFPELSHKNPAEPTPVGTPAGFGILEGGMQSGKTSCCLFVNHDGKNIFVEMSAEMFLSLAAALKGAMARFGQEWDGP